MLPLLGAGSVKPGAALLSKLTTSAEPLNEKTNASYEIGDVSVIIEYDDEEDEGQFIDIKSIIAKSQGRGDGTRALRTLTQLADEHGAVLTLYARAMDQKPHSTQRCIAWYKRHGFKFEGEYPLPGKFAPDLIDEDHHGADMWRPSKIQPSAKTIGNYL